MANDFNEWFGSGNLGRDPDRVNTTTGKTIAKFSIACNESYATAEGDKKENVTWFNIVAFDRLAETCLNYLKKGMFVVVKGKVSIKQYEGRDGTKKTSVDILTNKIRFLGEPRPRQDDRKNGDTQPRESTRQTPPDDNYYGDPGVTDSDIPF